MTPNDTYLGLRAFCDELVRSGVRHAVTSPGSRSTPLVLSLARERGLTAHSVIDERDAGFVAVGLAKATGAPAVLACTSGTAAANYAPAVIEAYEARVPLIVLTADRPPELRDNGAGQTIDQVKLYGRAAKWYLEIDDAPATPARMRWLRQLACRAALLARSGVPGPVHLNWALREPLVLDAPLPPDEPGGGGRPGGVPWLQAADTGVAPLNGARRPVIVAGRVEHAGGVVLASDAAAAGIPLLADPLSGARRAGAVAHYDAFLRHPDTAAGLQPDAVLRIGDLPVSKPLRQWLAGLDPAVPQYALTGPEDLKDPDGVVSHLLSSGVDLAADPEPGWLDAWRRADAALPAVRAVWAAGLSEPLVAERAHAALGADDTLVVAASMPIRDVDTFLPARDDGPRVLANRGANGIDGTVATALGVAAGRPGRTLLLTGDVALHHDIGGLLAARRLPAQLAILVIDNDGGGIFDFLPVAGEGADFTEHVTTRHGMAVADAARLAGAAHEHVTDPARLDGAVADALACDGVAIVEVRTDRAANVALHRATWAAVADVLHD